MKKIVCNCCGKHILEQDGIWREDFLAVEKEWGYFSKKDGEIHHFHICETCYDLWISSFVHAPKIKEQTELL